MTFPNVGNKDECASKSREAGLPAFTFGEGDAQGECLGEHVYVTQNYFDKYRLDQSNPTPACGKKQGDKCDQSCEWWENPYFNTYVINPTSMGEQASK